MKKEKSEPRSQDQGEGETSFDVAKGTEGQQEKEERCFDAKDATGIFYNIGAKRQSLNRPGWRGIGKEMIKSQISLG